MYCIILLPDTTGRVPTAQELRQRGFVVSTAVEPPYAPLAGSADPAQQHRNAHAGMPSSALAAEEQAPYGAHHASGI